MRDLVQIIDEVEKENDRLEQQVEILQANIRNGVPGAKGLIVDALMAGKHSVESIADYTGIRRHSVRRRLFDLWKLGVIRRRGPYHIGKANAMFFYGRKLR